MTFENLLDIIEQSGRPYDTAAITRAYELAHEAHEGQKRKSGEAYIEHPLNVAALLIDLGMDSDSIIAALLHDVVEDTNVKLEAIKRDFGAPVMSLVDGVTKLGQITYSSIEELQAENLRKMLLAMSHDIRVIIIKLCDRLHNMRTIGAMDEQKRRDKALETMEVYAPIAHRLGMNTLKEELEDISLYELDSIGYEEIKSALNDKGDALEFLDGLVSIIREKLEQNGVTDAHIESRVKSIYGIYRKVYVQNRSLAEIYDIYAIRIILNNVAECYNALGVIHDMYHPIPSRFKDYISMPKANMYQSLHTTVIGGGIPFEVQIRTWDMHHMAELGVSAHWKYKEGINEASDDIEKRVAWVRQLLESQRESLDAGDILRDMKSDLLPQEVFVFTPKGAVINLPMGATVIDFAYAIHSAVGNRMVGAKVNGRMVPIDHKVEMGEIIEVLTGPEDKGPSRDWINIVTTSEAKNKIRNWFKKERREENVAEGKSAFEKELRRNLMNIPDDQYAAFVEELAKRQHLNNAEELFASIGYGGTLMSRLIVKVKEEYAKLSKPEPKPLEVTQIPVRNAKSNEGVIVEGLDNCLIKFSKCCNPLPGDDIVGFITRGFGVSIHKRDCPNVNLEDKENAGRYLRAEWADGQKESFKSTLDIIALDREALFADVSVAIANMRVPLYAVNARQSTDGRAMITITIGIDNIEHLNSVIAKLKKLKDIISVMRV